MRIFKKLFNPSPEVGALEISDLALKFLTLASGSPKQIAMPLPPGVITRGKISDRQRLIRILVNFHQQIFVHQSPKKPIHTVLVVPASVVQAQAFTMPLVPPSEIEATAELNLRSLMPGDPKSFYSDYEIIGQDQQGKIEAMGAFGEAEAINDLVAVLKEADFGVVAVEFPGLALARLIKEYCDIVNTEAPTLVINLSDDGLELIVIKNGHHPDFSYFHHWSAIQEEVGGRQLRPEDVKEFLAKQIKQAINFHASRLGTPIKEAALIVNPLGPELAEMIKKDFGLDLQILTISKFIELAPIWYTVLGAATRGLIPRHKDNFINLAPPGIEKEYQQATLLEFIKYWRNAFAVGLGLVFLALLAATSFLVQRSASIAEKVLDPDLASPEEIRELQNAAKNFNQTVDFALKAQELSADWSPFLDKLKSLAGSKITIERLSVEKDSSAFLVGRAISDSAMLGFKDGLEKEPNFKEVILPLSNVKANEDGTVSFNLQFKISVQNF